MLIFFTFFEAAHDLVRLKLTSPPPPTKNTVPISRNDETWHSYTLYFPVDISIFSPEINNCY